MESMSKSEGCLSLKNGWDLNQYPPQLFLLTVYIGQYFEGRCFTAYFLSISGFPLLGWYFLWRNLEGNDIPNRLAYFLRAQEKTLLIAVDLYWMWFAITLIIELGAAISHLQLTAETD